MKFLVHTVGRDYFYNTKEYLDDQVQCHVIYQTWQSGMVFYVGAFG
jgi:hypothetical protein